MEELYSFDDDPREERDLAADPEFADALAAARERLASIPARGGPESR